jgi:hypothetical protein
MGLTKSTTTKWKWSNGVGVKVDTKKIAPKIKKASHLGLFALTQQVVKDSNLYVPMDTGNLMQSSLRASRFGDGKVVWDTPYARRLYYNPQFHFSKDVNPRAQGLWFEKAKSVHKKQWSKIAEKAVKNKL